MSCCAYAGGSYFFLGEDVPVIPRYIPEAATAKKKSRGRNQKVKAESPVEAAVVIDYDALQVSYCGGFTYRKPAVRAAENKKEAMEYEIWHDSHERYRRRAHSSNERRRADHFYKMRHEVVIYH